MICLPTFSQFWAMMNYEITNYRIGLDFLFDTGQIQCSCLLSVTPQIPIQYVRIPSPPVSNVTGSIPVEFEQLDELNIKFLEQMDPFVLQ